MTTETFPGPSSHTVSGTGPYEVGFGYSLGAITVFVEIDGEPVALAPEDYTVDPLYGVNGDVTLSGTAAATHDGRTLKIDRETEMQQGWAGYGNEREAGLELQLDRNVQALQDAARKIGRSLSVSGSVAIPPLTPADGRTIVWNAAEQKFENGPTIDEVADAQQYATSAQAWAINPEDTEVEPGSYSALHHATKAQAAKTASETARGAAESAASAASSDASAAANAAANASTSETNAAASASAAAASEANVASDASTASTAASNAATSETNAGSSASAALSSRTAAEAARDQTLAAFDSFDDRYLGPKASDPTLDNDSNPLVAGALYFNTTAEEMRVYTGATWVSAYVSGTGFLAATQNLSDLDDAAAALANLGLLSTASEIDAVAGSIVEFSGDINDLAQLPNGFYQVQAAATGNKPAASFNMISLRRGTAPHGNGTQMAFLTGTVAQYIRTWNGSAWSAWTSVYNSGTLPDPLKNIRDMSFSEGDVLYYNGTEILNLGIGAAGQVLKVNAGGDAPEWADAEGDWTKLSPVSLSGTNTLLASGLPAGVSEVKLLFRNMTLSGNDNPEIQLGEASVGIVATDYGSDAGRAGSATGATRSSTSGFIINSNGSVMHGTMDLFREPGTNVWIASHSIWRSTGAGAATGLSNAMDRIGIDTAGSDTFTAGTVEVRYR